MHAEFDDSARSGNSPCAGFPAKLCELRHILVALNECVALRCVKVISVSWLRSVSSSTILPLLIQGLGAKQHAVVRFSYQGLLQLMPTFAYSAARDTGEILSGVKYASSHAHLRNQLEQEGLLLQRARRQWLTISTADALEQELMVFVRIFRALLQAGLSVPEALNETAAKIRHPSLRYALADVQERLKEGKSLSQACENHADTLGTMLVPAIQAGENAGDLTKPLKQFQDYLAFKIELQKKVKQATSYPKFLATVMGILLLLIFGFVMPRMFTMYQAFSAKLPASTLVLMGIANHFGLLISLLAVVVAAVWAIWRWRLTNDQKMKVRSWCITKMPFIGTLYHHYWAAHFSRMMALLIGSGQTVPAALRCIEESGNATQQALVSRAKKSVDQGQSLEASLRQHQVLPDIALQMIGAGEKAGQLDVLCSQAADFYQEELEYDVARMAQWIEPILMLALGVIVGAVIVVMYLPILNLSTIVQ